MQTTNFWGTQWRVDDTNREVLDFAQTRYFWSEEGTINTNVNDNEKMGLLVLLGVFVNTIYNKRSAAGAS